MQTVEQERVGCNSDVYYDETYIHLTEPYRLDESFIRTVLVDPPQIEKGFQKLKIRVGGGILTINTIEDPNIPNVRACATVVWDAAK